MSYEKAFPIIIKAEGGYVNDPRDPGGETKYGISKRSFPHLDIKSLTLDEAKDIYYKHYWQPAGCDFMQWPMSLYCFDSAVNQGVMTAILLAQKANGLVDDGVIGQKSEKAFASMKQEQINIFMALRACRYAATKHFDVYGRGWMKRLFELTNHA